MTDWAVMREQAEVLVKSKLLPRAVDTPEKAIAIIQTGRELGIGPMQALRSIHVIEGKPTMSAELMAGLVMARLPGSVLRVSSTTNDECTVEAARAGQPATTFRFSMKDAQAAGLVGKDNWRKYPAAMLRARCLAAAARATFADATMGMLTADELGAVTTESGEVVDVDPRRGAITAHGDDSDEQTPPDAEVFETLLELLTTIENSIPMCKDYGGRLELRGLLGSKAKQSELTKGIQAAKEQGQLSPSQHATLSKAWARCHRQVEKLEKELPPPSAEESFVDEAEDFER